MAAVKKKSIAKHYVLYWYYHIFDCLFFKTRSVYTVRKQSKIISVYIDRTSSHALNDCLYPIILSTVSVKK